MPPAPKPQKPKAPPPAPLASVAFDLARTARLRQVLDALGYAFREPPPPGTVLFAQGAGASEGANIVVYRTGRLLAQGKRAAEALAELAAFELVPGGVPGAGAGAGAGEPAAAPGEPAAAGPAGAEGPPPPLIGCDESGKGDYFGPLVAVAAYVEPATWGRLRRLGVRDSKTIADGMVRRIAPDVRALCPHEAVVIPPARYNSLHREMRNVNHMLAWAHARAIEDLLGRVRCGRVLIDQFAADPRVVRRALMERGRAVTVMERPRAEEETAVAAASVIAREVFIDWLARAEERHGLPLPKGASAKVEDAARAFVAKHGAGRLGEVAKVHFKTTERVLPPLFGAGGGGGGGAGAGGGEP